ncbi:hypothetical protein L3X38_036235 [Prunus dulcis]|uniref:Uncharacterized protein n=1 Tax=Prunus dulcis TaxID=3755 RepID=A0AAD4V260_PRUDU|nr:hypothetical protein L3X38_036235 [Prunus dulcis]
MVVTCQLRHRLPLQSQNAFIIDLHCDDPTVKVCVLFHEIKEKTVFLDLNPVRRFDACDKNWNSRRGMHFFEWVKMKLVQEENKWSLVCLEDLEQWRRKVEQRKNN